MVFRLHIYALVFTTIIFSQVYQNGDYLKYLSGNICENDSLEWSSTKKGLSDVLFISSFATWWIPCQTESQEIEKIHKEFKDRGVEVIGAGMDWNNPFSCEEWVEKFNLTYPILDDSEGEKIYNYFGNGIVPYNVVIDRNMRLIYSSSGFNKDEIVDAIKTGLKTSIKHELPLKKNKLSQKIDSIFYYDSIVSINFSSKRTCFYVAQLNVKRSLIKLIFISFYIYVLLQISVINRATFFIKYGVFF